MKKLQILGPGCEKCQRLAADAERAAKDLGIPFEIEKVTNLDRIMSMGVMITPALAVDGVVKVTGRIPSIEDLKKLLR